MKKILLSLYLLFFTSIAFSQIPEPKFCNVGDNQSSIDNKVVVSNSSFGSRLIDQSGVIIIPVVVHVLYKNNDENLSISRIQALIDRMNTDCRKLNSDINLTPSPWINLTADIGFEFRLACVDPAGNTTSGIVRKSTSNLNFFGVNYIDAKREELGGSNAWPTDTYLNIWICDAENEGVAMFPWEYTGTTLHPVTQQQIPNSLLDGIVLSYYVVDNPNNTVRNKSRVVIHEIGHWLGLFHIYHNTNFASCSGTGDFVTDTPPQSSANGGYCSLFPLNDDCSPVPPTNGVMFMNFMDGSADDCWYMFTNGQRERARSYFSDAGPIGTRFPFLANYFGIKRFATTPVIVQNNIITVNLKNPACLPVVWSFSGRVTEISHTDHQIVFSVVCPSSGSVSVSATSGNYTDSYTIGFQNFEACAWPKIYEASECNGLKMDNNGNIFSIIPANNTLSNNINHNGILANGSGNFWIHYNKNSGVTNWIESEFDMGLPLNSDIINFITSSNNNIYRVGTTGVLVNGPSNAPTNEELLVEETGGLVTEAGYSLKSYSPSGTLISLIPIAPISGYILDRVARGPAFYNPITNNFFISHTYWSASLGNIFRVGIYHFDPFTYTITPINNPVNNQINGSIAQVNSAEKIFVYNFSGNILEEYNWQTNQHTLLAANNFVNNSLEPMPRSNQYVEDRILVKNTALNYFYSINTSAPAYTSTKISYTPPSTLDLFYNYYVFDGDYVFISGYYRGTGFSINNQPIPLLGSGSAFITKIPLSAFNKPSSTFRDLFTERNSQSVISNSDQQANKILVFPNPASNEINISGLGPDVTSIEITDMIGRSLLRKTFTSQTAIKLFVSNLMPGLYNCIIRGKTTNTVKKIFIQNK